jgi:hypothetical protein
MRGGRTWIDGVTVMPATETSSIPVGKSTAQMLMRSARLSSTRCTTNSPESRMFYPVSLCEPSGQASSPSTTMQGSKAIALK